MGVLENLRRLSFQRTPSSKTHMSAPGSPDASHAPQSAPRERSSASPAVDARAIASTWLRRLSAALGDTDDAPLTVLFAPPAVLRDSLVFSWDLRAPAGPAAIAAHMRSREGGAQGQVRDLVLDERPGLAPVVLPFDQPGAVSLAFTFVTPLGKGRGSARLFPRKEYAGVDGEPDEWIADSAYMMLDSLDGHEEAMLSAPRDPEVGHDVPWETSEAERRAKVEEEPYVLVVGAGQTGLMLAAHFQQLGLPTLLIEKDARIGDEWRRRYRTLALHTPKEHHTFLYSPYPETWPAFTPKEKLADWFEAYAKLHDLVIWTSAPLLSDPQPEYSAADGRWIVHIGRPDGSVRTLRCAHVVLATGTLGPPNVPAVAGADTFRGRALHARDFHSGAEFAGQRVLVVGAGNTAADACADLIAGGAARVTMLQRSASCLILPRAMAGAWAAMFPPGVDIALCDFRIAGVPYRVRERLILAEREARRARGEDPDVEPGDAERMRKVKEKGFLVDQGPGGRGLLFALLEKFGGHLIDIGFCELLIRGALDLKAGTDLARFTEDGLHFADGTSLDIDVVIYATGYQPATVLWAQLFGEETIERAGPAWGLDDEGELCGQYRPSGHPGLWYAGGDFAMTRVGAKQLGLLLLARKFGYAPVPEAART